MNALIIDLETGFKEKYGRKGNYLYNKIVAIGLCFQGEAYAKYLYPNDLEEIILEGIDVIVAHNATFDLLYLWNLESLQEFFKRGGKIWDTSLAEYILTGQQHKFPALRDIAVNKYGCPERIKFQEQYWEAGIDTFEIPEEIVLQDVREDVLDTEKIYLQQVEKAKELGVFDLIELENDALLATTEMTYNGMKVDLEELEKNKRDLEQRLEQQRQELYSLIAGYWK